MSELLCVDGPAEGKVVDLPYPCPIVFSEMGQCCGEWRHWKMRDVKYDTDGHFQGYGDWTYWQNDLNGGPFQIEGPHD